jgi:3-deoxy-manno-octulosonate cytidylyltransferase (CMP-KDO synthetase)
MKIACLIPARYNSSRFPGKLLQLARGKTVLQRTYESALSYFAPSQIVIATDDERIAEHAIELGSSVIWTSPDCLNGTERIAEAVRKSPLLSTMDVIVNLQGDHPCTSKEAIQAALEALLSNPQTPLSTLAIPLLSWADFQSPHVVKVVVGQRGQALYFSRSPIPFSKGPSIPRGAFHHLGLYCFRRPFLLKYTEMARTPLQLTEDLEQLKVLESGYPIQVAIVEESKKRSGFGIDTPQDLAQLEEFLWESNTFS